MKYGLGTVKTKAIMLCSLCNERITFCDSCHDAFYYNEAIQCCDGEHYHVNCPIDDI